MKLNQAERFLRWPEVARRVGICRSHAHALAAKGEFPKPIKIGPRASAWVESAIDEWVSNRIIESHLRDSNHEG